MMSCGILGEALSMGAEYFLTTTFTWETRLGYLAKRLLCKPKKAKMELLPPE